ncbi:hypothetical protein GGI23_001620 [Coemansia sp. RSA 2559]|nr:hypothetical protein GGI23_001620 [Coemansia sp. RSA 2559]KAJ2865888.1 hypothetical protein GGI22_001404 [Coemansia erecta]
MLAPSKCLNASLATDSASSSEGEESEPSDSSGSSSDSRGPGPDVAICPLLDRARLAAYADKSIRLARSLIAPLQASNVNMVGSAGRNPVEHAAEYIWQLGLEHPESGLVPRSDYDRIATLQFVNIWIMHILPALFHSPRAPPSADLARLSKCIATRRHSLGRRGPFWNGPSLSIAEIVVAPFADVMLHDNDGFIPDSQEYGAVSAWLAAIRCAL